MSKTFLFLIVIVCLAGVAVALFTDFNPVATLQNFISDPTSIVPSATQVWQLIKQNIFGFITGVGGMLVLAANAINKIKKSGQQTAQNWQGQLSESLEANTQLQTENQELQAKLSKEQETFTSTVQSLTSQLGDAKEDLRVAQEDVKRLSDDQKHLVFEVQKKDKALEKYMKRFGAVYVE